MIRLLAAVLLVGAVAALSYHLPRPARPSGSR